MIIHSSEFMPGGSPYNKDEASIERLLKRFIGFFEFLKEENIKSTTFEKIAKDKVVQFIPLTTILVIYFGFIEQILLDRLYKSRLTA